MEIETVDKKETDNRNFLLKVYRGIKPNYW